MMIASSGLAVMRAAAGRETTCVGKGLKVEAKNLQGSILESKSHLGKGLQS